MRSQRPIDRLPFDVRTEVFAATLPDPCRHAAIALAPDTAHRVPPHALLAVCRRWRDEVHATPALWTHLALVVPASDVGTLSAAARLLKHVVTRSGDRPLHLYLEYTPHDGPLDRRGWAAWEALAHTLVASSRRWQRASIRVQGHPSPGIAIDIAALARAPLCELALHDAALVLPPLSDGTALTRLAHLELHDYAPSDLRLLPMAPHLESLTLRGRLHRRLPPACPELSFPTLTALDTDGGTILGQIAACPSLRTLRCPFGPDLQPFVERSRPPLLTLSLPLAIGDDATPVLRSLPSLLALEISPHGPAAFFARMAVRDVDRGRFALCPRLQRFKLCDFAWLRPDEADGLTHFIHVRWSSPGRTLRHVDLGRACGVLDGPRWACVQACVGGGLSLVWQGP